MISNQLFVLTLSLTLSLSLCGCLFWFFHKVFLDHRDPLTSWVGPPHRPDPQSCSALSDYLPSYSYLATSWRHYLSHDPYARFVLLTQLTLCGNESLCAQRSGPNSQGQEPCDLGSEHKCSPVRPARDNTCRSAIAGARRQKVRLPAKHAYMATSGEFLQKI